MNIEDTREKVNDKVYVGPHKWIVCLIGSDSYTVKDFMLKNQKLLAKKENLHISIMGLSGEPFRQHTQDYIKLTKLTREGSFISVVKKETADTCARRFFGAMDVYHSKESIVVKEHFHHNK